MRAAIIRLRRGQISRARCRCRSYCRRRRWAWWRKPGTENTASGTDILILGKAFDRNKLTVFYLDRLGRARDDACFKSGVDREHRRSKQKK